MWEVFNSFSPPPPPKTMQVVQAWLQEQPTNFSAYGIRKFGPRIKQITVRNKKIETLSLLVFTNRVPLLLGCLCLTFSSNTSKVYLNDNISLPQLEANLRFQLLSLYSTPYSLVSITFPVIIIWKLVIAAPD